MLKVRTPIAPYTPAPPIEPSQLPISLEGIRLGVLGNQKPNSTELLNEIVAALKNKHTFTTVVQRFKTAQGSAKPGVIDDLVGTSDMVILASGD